jgi:hypothetical protein
MMFDYFIRGLEKKLAIVATACLLISCQSSKKEHIQGNWYSFDKDSSYFELYINDTMIVLNQPEIGPVGYDYKVQGDKLIVSNSVDMERVWQLVDLGSESMTLTDSLERLQYTRLELDRSFFESIADSTSFLEFLELYNDRFADSRRK